MKKRLLAVIICLMLLVAVLPAVGLTAYASEKEEIITEVDISSFTEPVAGQKVSDKNAHSLTVPAGAGYAVRSVKWYDSYGLEMLSHREFEKGNYYHACIEVALTGTGVSFGENVIRKINGSDVWVSTEYTDESQRDKGYDTIFIYTVDFALGEFIDDISLSGLSEPAAGERLTRAEDITLPEGAPYYISYMEWASYETGGYPLDDEYFTGGRYFAYINLTRTSNDYIFEDDFSKVTVNGETSLIDVERSSIHPHGIQLITTDFVIGEAITDIEISGYAEPKFGEKPVNPKDIIIPENAGYSVVSAQWMDVTDIGTPMAEGEVFESCRTYALRIKLRPNVGYYFDSDSLPYLTVNGEKTENQVRRLLESYSCEYDVWTDQIKVFDMIDSVQVTGFTEPKIDSVNAIAVKTPENAGYIVDDAYWMNIAESKVLEGDERFVDGSSYMMVIMLKFDKGCKVGEDCKVTINGSEELISEWQFINSTEEPMGGLIYQNDYMVITSALYEFRESIDIIDIRGMKVPQVGAASSAVVNIPNNSDYKLVDSYWVWEDDEYYGYMTDGEKFRSDRLYYLITEIEPNDNFTVDENTVININGAEDLVDYPYCTWDGRTLVVSSVVFDFRHNLNERRIDGPNRQKTAVNISTSTFYTGSTENVVLASGDNYADALAGAPLANALDTSILLVRNDNIDKDTLNEIKRLGAKNVYILGGELAVGKNTENLLKSKGYNVIRIAGANRFETAVKIAEKLEQLKGSPSEVFIAYGYNYPDALAVSSVAAVKGVPILYINSDGAVNASTAAFLKKCSELDRAYILGGYTAIAKAADSNIGKYADVERVYGSSRYDTCLAINKRFADCFDGKDICVATGTNYPDALAGGVFAARNKAPMVLCGNYLTNAQREYLAQFPEARVTILGGEIAVSNSVANMIPQYAE